MTEQEQASSYGMGAAKGQNAELVTAFNEGLKNLIEDGTYQQILDKYLGENSLEAAAIGNGQAALGNEQLEPGTPGELPNNPNFATDTPQENGTFVVAMDTTFAPFEFQENGEMVGIDMDLLRAIAANQGFGCRLTRSGSMRHCGRCSRGRRMR